MKDEMDLATHENLAKPLADSLTFKIIPFALDPAHKRQVIYISITHDLRGFHQKAFL